ncbi:MAG: FeoA family protein [Thermoanaerobaculia bacterium]
MDKAARQHLVCPLCGFEFEAVDTLCQHGCPMRTACGLVRCPSCDYEFPERPAGLSWFRSLFGGGPEAEDALCETCRPLTELDGGESARVVSLAGTKRPGALAVFGLVPGSEVTLLQRAPTYVVQVGETQLALEAKIAGGIFVERGM